MTNYFYDCNTIDEIKQRYRKLALELHPDRNNGDDVEFKIMLNQYHDAIDRVSENEGFTEKKTASQHKEADIFADIINELLKYPNIEIEVCGWWFYVKGDTKPIKDHLKALKLKWNKVKQCWYYKPEWYVCKSRGSWDMGTIRNTYGSQTVKAGRKNQPEIE